MGRREWDVESGRTARVGGMSVWAGSTLEWGVCTVGEGAQNPLAVLEWPEGTGIGQVVTWASSGTESAKAVVRRVARATDGHGACVRSWLGLGHMKGVWDAYGMAAAH